MEHPLVWASKLAANYFWNCTGTSIVDAALTDLCLGSFSNAHCSKAWAQNIFILMPWFFTFCIFFNNWIWSWLIPWLVFGLGGLGVACACFCWAGFGVGWWLLDPIFQDSSMDLKNWGPRNWHLMETSTFWGQFGWDECGYSLVCLEQRLTRVSIY